MRTEPLGADGGWMTMAQGQPNYTMSKMLRASAEAYGPSDAVVFPDDRRSYDELYRAEIGRASCRERV